MKKLMAVVVMMALCSPAWAFVVDPGDILIANNNWTGTSTIYNIDPVTGAQEAISLSGGTTGLQNRPAYYDSTAYPAWTGKIIGSANLNGSGGTEQLVAIDPADGTTTTFSLHSTIAGTRGAAIVVRGDGMVLDAIRYGTAPNDHDVRLVDPSDGSATQMIDGPGGSNIWTDIAMDPLDGTGMAFFAITNWQTNPGLVYYDGSSVTQWLASGRAGGVEVGVDGKVYLRDYAGGNLKIYEVSRAAGHAETLIVDVPTSGVGGFGVEADGNFVVTMDDGSAWNLNRVTANPGDPGASAVALIRAATSGTPIVVPSPAAPIPEPAGLGLIALSLLAVRKRRR